MEYKKRWFFDHEIDLLIWLNADNEIVGFQLCYDKLNNPHALTWFKDTNTTALILVRIKSVAVEVHPYSSPMVN